MPNEFRFINLQSFKHFNILMMRIVRYSIDISSAFLMQEVIMGA